MERFKEIDEGSPGTFPWFTLVCTELSRELQSLAGTLRRVRDRYGFYEDSHAVKENSFQDYVAAVMKHGRSEADATFLFEKVLIETDIMHDAGQCAALFKQALTVHLPEYQELPAKSLGDIYRKLAELLRSRKTSAISRSEIEVALRDSIEPANVPQARPVRVHTAINEEPLDATGALTFEWSAFWGCDARQFPEYPHWNERLLEELTEAKNWIVQHRGIRRIRLTGTRRLSTSLAIGAIYSAVAGFSIDMVYRGEIWSTDAHQTLETPDYPFDISKSAGQGKELIVIVGILRDIFEEVNDTLKRLHLGEEPVLCLTSSRAILSPEQANLGVGKIKRVIVDELSRNHATKIHLFLAGPAFLALFLGHRLNATTTVQCYERTSPSIYVPTCLLFSANG